MRRLICFLLVLFLFPVKVFAAKVLQVKSSNTFLLGDNNRTYSVKLACIEIDPKKQLQASSFLKTELPRNVRVNIKPRGFDQGVMVASIVNMRSNEDLAELLESNDLGRITC